MKLRIFLYLVAFGIGLAVPHLQLLFKLLVVAVVFIMDAATNDESEKRKYSVYVIFIIGLLVSYLYKLIVL